ncbi:hypothetical protein BDQ12DRAFT_709458 [Crucibulum laeve]|uniref:INO80 complex subunit F domain-containing protein n=1 Tax=Crucibulum laeve TaxID=68775 RepID=A0A5C3MEI8_9AGAR|nr:hypothetical protein BDQ12DRAFT_709458 [Crucibulum laeve]
MSRHTSPGPSVHNSLHPASAPVKQKQKQYGVGITAGAEDVKYQAKYKDLKRKVKEIEADNDKLHFKVLQAKRSIQRMKLERAILYERLSVVPPSPDMHDRHPLPPVQPTSGVPHPQQVASSRSAPPNPHREHPSSNEPDPILVQHIRSHGNPRVMPGPDGRPIPVMDPPMGAPPLHLPSGAHEAGRHLPPIPPPGAPVYEGSRSHSHSHSQHASPPLHPAHTHERHERERTKSSHSSRSRSHQGPPESYHQPPYQEGLPSMQHVLHSPPLAERDRERSRRHNIHELAGPHGDPHGHQIPISQMSPRSSHASEPRSSSGRVHNHQRLGPGTYLNREDHPDRHRDIDRDREWERERERDREHERPREHVRSREVSASHMHSPHTSHRSARPIDREYHDHHRGRDEGYYHDPPPANNYPMHSRSGSPGSDGPSRPDSRTQHYEQDQRMRSSSYRLRPVTQPNEDMDFVHEDDRSQSRDRGGAGGGGGGNYAPPEHNHPSMGSRKRTRNDMEVDSENDVGDGPPGGGALYSTGRLQEDRGSKRYHREHPRRSVDDHEDSRMGPS